MKRWAVLLMTAALAAFAARADMVLSPPVEGFLLDRAEMVNENDAATIAEACKSSLDDHRVPIFVVTIESMALYGGENKTIEEFSFALYQSWAAQLRDRTNVDWTRGILLVVSQKDRRARIEFGFNWRHRYDAPANSIMGNVIVRRFKQGQFSRGIAEGVQALAKMPGLNELRATILSMINQPATKLVRTIKEPSASLARVVKAKSEKA